MRRVLAGSVSSDDGCSRQIETLAVARANGEKWSAGAHRRWTKRTLSREDSGCLVIGHRGVPVTERQQRYPAAAAA
jgi:hypothetical protein